MLRDLHDNFAWVVVASNALAGIWVLAANWWEGLRGRPMWVFVIAAEVSIFVQVALGVALVTIENFEAPEFHMFYGFIALVTVGLIYSYRQQAERYLYLLYGLGSLFLMGLAIRSMVVGPVR